MKRILCLLFAVALLLVSCKGKEPDPDMVVSAGDFSVYILENGNYNIHHKSIVTDIYFPQARNHTPSLRSIDINKDEQMDALLINYQSISHTDYGQKISLLIAEEFGVEKIDCPLDVKDLYEHISFSAKDKSNVLVEVGSTEYSFAVLENKEFESGELDEKIEYDVKDGQIIATTRIALRFKGQAHSSKYGYIDATLNYKNGKFSFTDVKYRNY